MINVLVAYLFCVSNIFGNFFFVSQVFVFKITQTKVCVEGIIIASDAKDILGVATAIVRKKLVLKLMVIDFLGTRNSLDHYRFGLLGL